MSVNHINEVIWNVVSLIPHGHVATYGQVASLSGYSGYSRHVGSVLKQLPDDSRLPWHRVINAQGKISFPESSLSYERQRKRLEDEGVIFNGSKISLSVYQWAG